jgi:hypothetical protein
MPRRTKHPLVTIAISPAMLSAALSVDRPLPRRPNFITSPSGQPTLHTSVCCLPAKLLLGVGESRFEHVANRLPRAAVELNQSQVFDRPKIPRSSADFDPR